MKKAAVIILVVTISLIISYYYFGLQKSRNLQVVSPLPSLLTRVFPKAMSAERAWRPNSQAFSSNVKKPQINSAAALSYDLTDNKFLFQKNVSQKLPIASLTKIMTAVVALENEDLSEQITIGSRAATIGEDSMGLAAGEKFTLEEVIYGLILNSGNDAAEAIAANSPFGRDNFVYLMNKKAEDLGLSDTHFTNPTGLEGDGRQYSTVHDLLVLTRYALANPEFAKVAATYQYSIAASTQHKEYQLYNETNLLTSYPGVKGVKTGYTDEAGMCLVTYLDYDGHQIIAILLNAENRRLEMKDLLDYSLKSLGVVPPPHA